MKDYIISFGEIRFCRNSKYLQPGDWFVCENQSYIQDALKTNPAGLIVENKVEVDLPQIIKPDIRYFWSELALIRFPRMPKFIAGITGTNGKTSTAYLAYKLFSALGCKAGYIGTIGIFPDIGLASNLTTPDAAVLHEILDLFALNGITHVCIEISSSGLLQKRASQLQLDAAVFTSFSPEHLDVHGTIEEYWKTKLNISELIKKDGIFIINEDLFDELKTDLELYYPKKTFNLIKYNNKKYQLTCGSFWKSGFVSSNLNAAAYICEKAGFDSVKIQTAIDSTELQVPGRMQLISNIPFVLVDFAHTPDALEKLLSQFPNDKIIVFGCGGDRDKSKRKPMGEIANRLAKFIILTDDNPRTEDPCEIRQQIKIGCPNAIEIPNRRDAIKHGISLAIKMSIPCIIAGKGNESFQIYGSEKRFFSDAEVAKEILKENCFNTSE